MVNIDTQLYIQLLEAEVYRLRGTTTGREALRRQGASMKFGVSPAEAAEQLEQLRDKVNEDRNR